MPLTKEEAAQYETETVLKEEAEAAWYDEDDEDEKAVYDGDDYALYDEDKEAAAAYSEEIEKEQLVEEAVIAAAEKKETWRSTYSMPCTVRCLVTFPAQSFFHPCFSICMVGKECTAHLHPQASDIQSTITKH